MTSRWTNATGAALLALGLTGPMTGCAALNPTAPSLYTLTPGAVADAGLPRVNWQLLVEPPAASAGIDTPRIAVTRSATALDYFAGVSWADRAPGMVQGLIVQSFEDSRRIVSVGRDSAGLRSDFVLKTELRDFQAEFADDGATVPDRVRVRLSAKLVAMPSRTIEAGDTFDAMVPVRGSDFTDVIAAFNEALGQVQAALVDWTLRSGNAVFRTGASRSG
ncbi:ABC-type transport auxiliary lipoprotein family protein [Azospirillum isscasi]|uniref:ABC-type transport auxiliary lipoprotein family protein n=1 Tax=Azospirillum isscasi TaxID=3053926 RepID=A0ABU0WCF5_9PROT|nr:ABC-type transport auxiliary lipoprotein family protein [Azospirillum isscasi]MDQ2101870.1 ABC-type transport auxiliary lipoprotein family protein [Azospirillum isscasi]